MPPKKTCSSRSKTVLQYYIKQADAGKDIKLQLAAALKNKGYLSKFDKLDYANECIFSYPDVDWYSIYIKDQDGNLYWDSDDGTKVAKYYFKIDIVDDKPVIVDGTVVKPDEIKDDRNCVISGSGTCVNPAKLVTVTPEKKIKKAAAESAPPAVASQEILSKLKEIKVGSSSSSSSSAPKQKVDREFFENKDKATIIKWMLGNMNIADIHSCIQRGGLSQKDIQAANEVAAEYNKVQPVAKTNDLEILIDSINQMSVSDIDKIIKQVSKEELTKMIKDKGDRADWKKKLIPLCIKNGIQPAGLSIDRMFGQCVSAESVRLRTRISAVLGKLPKNMVTDVTKQSLLSNDPSKNVPAEYKDYVSNYFPKIKSLSVIDGVLNGAFPVPGKSGYYKPIQIKFKNLISLNKEMDEGKILAFGRRMSPQQLKFRRAAKQCRGSASCMKKMLK